MLKQSKTRVYHLDEDYLEVVYLYDEDANRYFGEYPDFEETPRFTPRGRPWVNSTIVGCPYADENYDDCGSCQYMCREKDRDIIGVCMNEVYRINT